MEKVTVLVTGGSGLVGNSLKWAISHAESTLRQQENERWVFCSSSDGDLRSESFAKLRLYCLRTITNAIRDMKATEALFKLHRPRYVIHLAARVSGNRMHRKEPVTFSRDNLLIDINVLEMAKRFGV